MLHDLPLKDYLLIIRYLTSTDIVCFDTAENMWGYISKYKHNWRGYTTYYQITNKTTNP